MKKKIVMAVAATMLAGSAVVATAAGDGFRGCKDGDGWGRSHQRGGMEHHKGSEMMGARMLNMLDWKLELSEEQRTQIRSLMKERQTKMQEDQGKPQIYD